MAARVRLPKTALPFPGQPWVDPALVVKARSRVAPPVHPGDLIATFEVDGEPIPWRAPTQGKHVSYTPKNVTEWKQAVAKAAHDAGYGEANGFSAYPFPIMLSFWFCRKCPKSRKPGDFWDSRPDCD